MVTPSGSADGAGAASLHYRSFLYLHRNSANHRVCAHPGSGGLHRTRADDAVFLRYCEHGRRESPVCNNRRRTWQQHYGKEPTGKHGKTSSKRYCASESNSRAVGPSSAHAC